MAVKVLLLELQEVLVVVLLMAEDLNLRLMVDQEILPQQFPLKELMVELESQRVQVILVEAEEVL